MHSFHYANKGYYTANFNLKDMISQLFTQYTPTLDAKNNSVNNEPFYQGQLDVFCAVYAVLNAVKITHNINAILARNILHNAIMELALQPEVLSSVLEQKTDYIFLVDKVLASIMQVFPLKVEKPFPQMNNLPSPEHLFNSCEAWLSKGVYRAVILRYLQYRNAEQRAINKHWTTVHVVENNILHFFDCSHKKHVILQAKLSEYTTDLNKISADRLMYIQPSSIRFIQASI